MTKDSSDRVKSAHDIAQRRDCARWSFAPQWAKRIENEPNGLARKLEAVAREPARRDGRHGVVH